MRRVAVTGLGVVSPVGSTIDSFWSALVAGRTGIGPLQAGRQELFRTRIAAEVRDFAPEDHFPSRRLAFIDRFSAMAVVAARAAREQSGLSFDGPLGLRTAALIGTGVGGIVTLDESYWRLYRESRKPHPFTVPKMMPNAASSQVSIDLGLKGPAFSVVSACASGTHAVGLGFQMIRGGMADVAFCGGAEASIATGPLLAWEALRVVSDDTCRPFSKNRSGLVIGEGAAVLALEEWEHARARGADILAEVRGFGMSADAGDAVAPDQDGGERAMRAALDDAGANPGDIDYINAHGTATMLNDATETRAIRGVFGAHADKLAISSNKGVLGHSLGAAGALEAAATVLTLGAQVAPPTANYQEPDPECDLDVIPNEARDMRIGTAMSNSFAFGGLNAVLVMGKA
ncbi:MAG: beta-ketoacyl-[acyl-carrier-protein] synthase family protein [Bauldia sp.]|nr:beta-ketoacyl-[acyl-carrier-protein] synthase family protein [Bauldia sp.]